MGVLDEKVSIEELKNTLNNIEPIHYGKPFIHEIYSSDNPDFSFVVVEEDKVEDKSLEPDFFDNQESDN